MSNRTADKAAIAAATIGRINSWAWVPGAKSHGDAVGKLIDALDVLERTSLHKHTPDAEAFLVEYCLRGTVKNAAEALANIDSTEMAPHLKIKTNGGMAKTNSLILVARLLNKHRVEAEEYEREAFLQCLRRAPDYVLVMKQARRLTPEYNAIMSMVTGERKLLTDDGKVDSFIRGLFYAEEGANKND